MGVFLDIATFISNINDAVNTGVFSDSFDIMSHKMPNRQYSSISKRASEGTLQFPVIISSSIDIETAQNISKALERNYSTFAQIAFSFSPTSEYKQGWNAHDYIKQFHQNVGLKNDFYDVIDGTGLMREESFNCIEDENIVFIGATYESATKKIVAENKDQLFDLMEHLRHDILNNKYIPKTEVIYNFKNQELNQKYNNMTHVAEAKDKDVEIPQTTNSTNLYKDVLRDNDVKKSNELVATTLHLRVRLVNKEGKDVGNTDFIIGIKCIMHPVKSNDMVINMVNACRNNNKVFNYLRWTTGEISFFKDFLLAMDETKADVTAYKRGSSPWWSALKRRRTLAKMGDNLFIGKKILPNSTVVISAEEVEFIKSEYGYDLYNPIFFKKIMSEYFLLGFVIVDSSAQIAHFLYEDQTNFQTVTFSALEKSSVNDERKFKEMLKVVNRM